MVLRMINNLDQNIHKSNNHLIQHCMSANLRENERNEQSFILSQFLWICNKILIDIIHRRLWSLAAKMSIRKDNLCNQLYSYYGQEEYWQIYSIQSRKCSLLIWSQYHKYMGLKAGITYGNTNERDYIKYNYGKWLVRQNKDRQ